MNEEPQWSALRSPVRINLIAFEAGLARFPIWMIAALLQVAELLENKTSRKAHGVEPASFNVEAAGF